MPFALAASQNPLRQKINFLNQINVICPVQSPSQKYFCFPELKPVLYSPPSRPKQSKQRGVSRSSQTRGGLRWPRAALLTLAPMRTEKTCGPDAASPHQADRNS